MPPNDALYMPNRRDKSADSAILIANDAFPRCVIFPAGNRDGYPPRRLERFADEIKILTGIISYPEARAHARTHAHTRARLRDVQ